MLINRCGFLIFFRWHLCTKVLPFILRDSHCHLCIANYDLLFTNRHESIIVSLLCLPTRAVGQLACVLGCHCGLSMSTFSNVARRWTTINILITYIHRCVINHGLIIPMSIVGELRQLGHQFFLGLELRHHRWSWYSAPSSVIFVVDNKCMAIKLLKFTAYWTWLKAQIWIILAVLWVAGRPHLFSIIKR